MVFPHRGVDNIQDAICILLSMTVLPVRGVVDVIECNKYSRGVSWYSIIIGAASS